ncbi:MAG: prephenate dehydratase [Actinomycetota bacterium]|nr:prephenate dehydratase [Actinomycetota bacterium]
MLTILPGMEPPPRRQVHERVAYLGPAGTFTEEALLSQPDLASADLVPMATMDDVLTAAAQDAATLAFAPIENSIEGSVNATLDRLVFDHDLLIQREVLLDVHLNLLAPPGAVLRDITQVLSYPVALPQCRRFLADRLPAVDTVATKSTAEAARLVAEGTVPGAAAVAPAVAAKVYGLEVVASDIEDHPGNQTRFVAVASAGIPAATGHDRTSVVCFQRADEPGSLLGILEQFAARSINLTRLESRPTRQGLGQYCFVLDMEGHIQDEVVADCLRNLHTVLERLKFLGSYPAAGPSGPEQRRQVQQGWLRASRWVDQLRSQVLPDAR